MIVRLAVFDAAPSVAEMVEVVFDDTEVVLTWNVIEVLPAGMVTVVGTMAEELEHNSSMTRPPVGAGELIVTAPVLDFPPATVVGLRVSDLRVGAVIVNVAVLVTLPRPALKVVTV